MFRFRRRAALSRAASSVVRQAIYYCEPLEGRVMLDGDPVLVLTEPFFLTSTVTAQRVQPWLWKNPLEFPYDLSAGNWSTNDGDGNGKPGDVYGWNFESGGSPNIIGVGTD